VTVITIVIQVITVSFIKKKSGNRITGNRTLTVTAVLVEKYFKKFQYTYWEYV